MGDYPHSVELNQLEEIYKTLENCTFASSLFLPYKLNAAYLLIGRLENTVTDAGNKQELHRWVEVFKEVKEVFANKAKDWDDLISAGSTHKNEFQNNKTILMDALLLVILILKQADRQ